MSSYESKGEFGSEDLIREERGKRKRWKNGKRKRCSNKGMNRMEYKGEDEKMEEDRRERKKGCRELV